MPLYEYECQACGHRFERIRKFSDPPLEACPQCGGAIEKLVSSPAFHLKGSGWYATDYAKKVTEGAEKGSEKTEKTEKAAESTEKSAAQAEKTDKAGKSETAEKSAGPEEKKAGTKESGAGAKKEATKP
jgi:putative FmdB family regulatory protein